MKHSIELLKDAITQQKWFLANATSKENYPERVKYISELESELQQLEGRGETVLMPKKLTAENGSKGLMMGEFFEYVEIEDTRVEVPVSWTTIKRMYDKLVEYHTAPELTPNK